MSTALLSMYDFVDYRNSNPTSSNPTAVSVASSTGDKAKANDRMNALYHHQLPIVAPIAAPSSAHKMSGGIRRTVSSAAPSSAMAPVSRPLAPGSNGVVVKSIGGNTQQSSAVRVPTSVHHIAASGKDPHKKLDRSFSEPAEKKNAIPVNGATAASSASASLGPSSRYKTELCRSFAEVGSCKYGDKCQFAHGDDELRIVSRHPKFKTENCKSFHSTGFCPYGPRCHFIHNTDETKKNVINSNGSSGPVIRSASIDQRMADAPVAVIGNHMAGAATSQPVPLGQPSAFASANSAAAVLNNANLIRPKALSLGSYSLGSSGELSPPSSQSGSPTSLNSFFTEDGFGLATGPFGSTNSRMAAMNAFQTTSSNTFSFSPDSAFVSFASGASSNGSTSGSSLSFADSNSAKSIFGGSQPTLSSRFSPEPTCADESTSSVLFSLFGNGSETGSQLNDFLSPLGKSQLMMYPSSPESPVDSVASEIEALKLGEVPSSFSPISSSFSTSSLSISSASPPNGLIDHHHWSAAPGSALTNIPTRLPTFTKFATSAHD